MLTRCKNWPVCLCVLVTLANSCQTEVIDKNAAKRFTHGRLMLVFCCALVIDDECTSSRLNAVIEVVHIERHFHDMQEFSVGRAEMVQAATPRSDQQLSRPDRQRPDVIRDLPRQPLQVIMWARCRHPPDAVELSNVQLTIVAAHDDVVWITETVDWNLLEKSRRAHIVHIYYGRVIEDYKCLVVKLS